MIKLKKLERKTEEIRPYIKKYGGIFNDLTLGTRFMWDDEFGIEYAVYNETLIMREMFSRHKSFYYPMGKDVAGALDEIEKFCAAGGTGAIAFGCLTEDQAKELSARYAGAKKRSYRDWCDYIYPAEQFKTYAGGKLAGQRNHVNRFMHLFPDYKVNIIAEKDIPAIKEFLREYEKENDLTGLAAGEQARVYDLLDNMAYLEQFGIFVTVNGKTVSVSVGEIQGETLFVHVEKGLKEYDGVYPFTAREFAKAFAGAGVEYINREEDCGDAGLRVSKTQYHPSEIKRKYYVFARSAFALIAPPFWLKTERLEITDIYEKDKDVYAALYTDDKVNEFYGYDYRRDLGDEMPNGDYFFKFMQNLKAKKEEYSLAVRLNGEMIGEIVLYNFGIHADAEIGFRFFTDYQGKGYAIESVAALIDCAFTRGFGKIVCRHFKENARSEKLILKLGFTPTGENETHKFYELKK